VGQGDSVKNIFRKFLTSIMIAAVALQSGSGWGMSVASAAEILMPSNTFSLPMIRGLQFDPAEPLNFNFVIDLADQNSISEESALKLVRYFMAALAVPQEDVWVNLSPDGKGRIIPDSFGATEAGEDLFKQDLLLKKLSASFLHPDQDIGRKFWDAAYQKIYDVYGLTDIPQDVFSRIWIVPQRAVVDEFQNAAYISESRLKILMADEYDSFKGLDSRGSADATDDAHRRVTEIMKDVVIPEIEKQVNEGEHFAVLRQVYQSMILAIWFKSKLKDHIVNRVYSDTSKVEGIDMADGGSEAETFDSYLKIFRDGIYNSIREEYDSHAQQMVARQYVSGGFGLPETGQWMTTASGNLAMLDSRGKNILLSVSFFLLTAAGMFGQGILNRGDPILPQDRPAMQLLERFVTVDDVVGLNGQQNPLTGKIYNIDANYIRANWNQIFKAPTTYGWAQEAAVIAAQKELGLPEDGDLGPLVIQGMQRAAPKQSQTPSLPGGTGIGSQSHAASGGVSAGGSGVGLTINNVPDSLLGGEFKPDFADESYQRSLQATDAFVKTPLSLLNFKFSSRDIGSALTNVSLAKDHQLIAAYFASVNSRNAGAPPPPFSAMAWTDFGRKPWAYYGTYNLTYDPNGPLSFWTTTEPTGLWQKGDKPAYTVAQYFGFGYQANPRLFLSLEERWGLKGGVNRLTTASAKFTPKNGKYSLTAMFHLPRMWSDTENRYMNQQALTFSTGTTLLGISITPAVFVGPDFSDWSLNVAYNFSSSFGISFEKNFRAAYGFYNYIPNLPLRLNILYTMGNWGFVPYFSSTTYNLFDSQFVYGLALKRTLVFPKPPAAPKTNSGESFTLTPPDKSGTNKAMMKEVKPGGIDLKMDDAQLETRVHGNFEGLNNLDVNLINPETFTGFGVKLIRMVPVFDLSKVFMPADDAPVMILQL